MTNPQPSKPKLTPASEYALIVGAGATAAVSIAAQQVAAASLPITTLVALGLLNRYRLDQRLQDSQPVGQPLETASPKLTPPAPQRGTASPRPDRQAHRPQTVAAPTPAARFSHRRDYIHESLAVKLQAQADVVARQQASLQRVGADLKQHRQAQGWSVDDVYQQTFIQPYTIKAIETGNLSQLPEPFYIRAFLQKYAVALGLDGAIIADQFPVA
ncbi:helix-turn-helix transcriptional regulator [Nodosilinea sp. P-1105]|uniref:helix-turn-helix domain-containing protein n=1 Tax=Nodosilinea sp. P-1105 TaxID=2546229 RepID=UPI00146B6980|nr:helix-turn-helix transcriptional regulator [Nodosilinea sp. P-1105]NMF82276.1 helix-turn-helix domain-containing protein [Nodosilinea sp. P-1105]